MAGPMVGPLLERLGLDLVETYWVPDGEFPDHEPNPLLPENRQFIIDRVLAEGADLGIAWDGDADRCFFIDDNGEFVDGDFLTALLAGQVLAQAARRRRSSTTSAPAARSPTRSRAAGGTSHINRVGHAFFKQRDARARRRVRRRGLRPLLLPRLLVRGLGHAAGAARPRAALGSRDDRSRSWSASSASRYFISGEINSEVADQDAKMKEIAERHADAEISWLDGVSVDYPDWHFNVRPSNTEPLLRLNLESLVSREDMEAKRDEVLELIRS